MNTKKEERRMKFVKHKIQLIDIKTKKVFRVDGWIMHMDLYKCNVEIAFGQEEKIRRFYTKACHGFVHTDENSHLIWVKTQRYHQGCLVHELYHLVNRISKEVGLSDDMYNEQQAYLLGWLFDEVRRLK